MEQENRSNLFYYVALSGLTFAHLVTAIRWYGFSIWGLYDNSSIKSACYPFFSQCLKVSFDNPYPIKYLLITYITLSCLFFIPLLLNKKKIALFIFLLLFAIKTFIFVSRYNIMGNYHIMHLSLIIGILLCYGQSTLYRLIVCLQYFFAGLLKINMEWLSGAAMVSYPRLLPEVLFGPTLVYVIVLELVLIWGLLSQNHLLRRLTLLQLVIFHGYSYFIVGYFYPMIMLGILIPLFIEEWSNLKLNWSFDYKRRLFYPCYAFIALIVFWNVASKFSEHDPAKDGRVRYFSLNMLDAKTSCNLKLIEVLPDKTIRTLNIPALASAIRVWCDPVIFEGYLKRLCEDPEFKKSNSILNFHLETRRYTENEFEPIRETKDVCKKI
jgi:hypothetical protein